MQRIGLSLLTMSLALFMGAQTALAQSADETALNQAVDNLRKAALDNDRKQFEALLSDHVSYGHSSARVEDKALFIKNALASKAVRKSLTFTEQTNKIVGNSAIVRFIYNGESELDGKPNSTKIGVLTVWQKENGAWKLFARQGFKL